MFCWKISVLYRCHLALWHKKNKVHDSVKNTCLWFGILHKFSRYPASDLTLDALTYQSHEAEIELLDRRNIFRSSPNNFYSHFHEIHKLKWKSYLPFICEKVSSYNGGKTNTFFVVANDNLLIWIFNAVKQLSYVVQSIAKKAIPLTRKYALEKV